MQITSYLTHSFNKACFAWLVFGLTLVIPVSSYSQIRMLHHDPEFDEYRIRKHLLVRGFSVDSAEALVNAYKYQYYKNLEVMHAQKTTATPSDGTASGSGCLCFASSCWDDDAETASPTYLHAGIINHENVDDRKNFFDDDLDAWYTKLSTSFTPNVWSYSGSWGPLSTGISAIPQRFKLNTNTDELDPFTNEPIIARGSKKSVRVGSPEYGIHGQKLATHFTKKTADKSFDINYSIVLYDPPVGHSEIATRPAFSIRVFVKPPENDFFYEDCCMKYEVYSSPKIPGFKQAANDETILYKPWSQKSVDLTRYADDTEVIVEITAHHCAYGPHFSYAYVDGIVNNPKSITKKGPSCPGSSITFSSEVFGTFNKETITWSLQDNRPGGATITKGPYSVEYPAYKTLEQILNGPGNEDIKTAVRFTHLFDHQLSELPVNYTLSLTVANSNDGAPVGCGPLALTRNITITDCYPVKVECEDCISSFAPIPGKKYVVSAWVKQNSTSQLTTYTGPEVWIRFNGINTSAGPFKGSGVIIDGWQKIEEVFTVPEETSSLEIELKNTSTNDVLFDDIRVYPFDGAMRSFVYNAKDFKLNAELDENNYATFYDYDEQGDLVRVRRETVKGVQTVKEIFTNTHLKP